MGVGRGDTVFIPRFSQNGSLDPNSTDHADDRSTFGTAAALAFTAIQEAQIPLLIDKMSMKAFNMPAEMSAQAMTQYEPLLISGIAEAIALHVDFGLADFFNDMGGKVGTDNNDITDDDILECETNLDNNNSPMAMRSMVISPATRGSLMKIEAVRNQLYDKTVGNIKTNQPGFLGNVYSFAVYRSNNLETGSSGHINAAFQMEAVAYASQKGISIERQLQIAGIGALDGLVNTFVGWQVWGAIEVVDLHGNTLLGK